MHYQGDLLRLRSRTGELGPWPQPTVPAQHKVLFSGCCDYPVNAISERYGFEKGFTASILIPVLWLERGKGGHA